MKLFFVNGAFLLLLGLAPLLHAQQARPAFRVIAFYTAKSDQAHISFVHEANAWLAKLATAHRFSYDSTHNWHHLNPAFLRRYQVVLFLDTRPEAKTQRAAFTA